jgi:hypothetical protein
METVARPFLGSNTGEPGSPEIAGNPFEAKLEAEKEGFEPSMEAFTPITP